MVGADMKERQRYECSQPYRHRHTHRGRAHTQACTGVPWTPGDARSSRGSVGTLRRNNRCKTTTQCTHSSWPSNQTCLRTGIRGGSTHTLTYTHTSTLCATKKWQETTDTTHKSEAVLGKACPPPTQRNRNTNTRTRVFQYTGTHPLFG